MTRTLARTFSRRAAVLAVALGAGVAGAWLAGPATGTEAAAAAAAAKKRYYVEIEVAKDKTGGDKAFSEQVVKAVAEELKGKPIFVVAAPGDGAPAASDEAARTAWLKDKGLTGLSLQLTLEKLTEKKDKEKDHLTLTFEMRALLITRPGGWMIVSTNGIGESDGYARKPVLESAVAGAAAGAAENLAAHLAKKPVEDKPKH
ncbi:MAG TPA: hypothetical protein VG389_02335 [Myxococcota bacterium]|jgi:hypothetical protein|nr:hypothetical protein [Myxococcota bacterium]